MAMQWDHLPGTEKLGEISGRLARRARGLILSEIAKCELVCANCHAIRTYQRLQRAHCPLEPQIGLESALPTADGGAEK